MCIDKLLHFSLKFVKVSLIKTYPYMVVICVCVVSMVEVSCHGDYRTSLLFSQKFMEQNILTVLQVSIMHHVVLV